VAKSVVRATLAELPRLRSSPGMPSNVLRYADAQAIVGVAAVVQATQAGGWSKDSIWGEWGVVAAPRYFGRLSAVTVIDRHGRRGPVAVSPLVAPHMSLHSVAGCVSLALNSHGPVSGLGGGIDALSDGFLGGLSLLSTDSVAGVWVVLTAFDPEPRAENDPDAVCHGAALALAPPTRFLAEKDPAAGSLRLERGIPPSVFVAELGEFIENDRTPDLACALVGRWRLTLAKAPAARYRAA